MSLSFTFGFLIVFFTLQVAKAILSTNRCNSWSQNTLVTV